MGNSVSPTHPWPPQDQNATSSNDQMTDYRGTPTLYPVNKCFRIFVNLTQSERTSDSIYWLPTPTSPPLPTDKEMLAFAIDELKEATNALHNTKTPLVALRKMLLDRANTIDEFISIYYPKIYENSEDYTLKQIETDDLPNIDNDPTIHEANDGDNEEAQPEEQPEEIDPVVRFIDEVIQPLANSPPPIEEQEPKRRGPQRERRFPKHFDGFVLSMLEASIVASEINTVGLDRHGDPLTYRTAISGANKGVWKIKLSEEYDRLTKTGTIHWNGYMTKPLDKKATYFSIQVKEKRLSDGTIKRRVRGTVGGDRVEITGEVSSGTASMDVLKIFLNAVVSEESFWSSCDITDYYLGTPMDPSDWQWMYIKNLKSLS